MSTNFSDVQFVDFPHYDLCFDITSNNNFHLTKKIQNYIECEICHGLLIRLLSVSRGKKTFRIMPGQLLFLFENKSTLFSYNNKKGLSAGAWS